MRLRSLLNLRIVRSLTIAAISSVAVASAAVASDLPPLGDLPFVVGGRPIDGMGNNLADPFLGSAGTALLRLSPSVYADGISAMAGAGRPNTRVISNSIGGQVGSMPDGNGLSGFFWAFGQLLDHDLDLTFSNPAEQANIPILPGDPLYDALPDGGKLVPFNRSAAVAGTGTSAGNPREQANEITSFIDASFVYGSSDAQLALLRASGDSGRLLTSAGNLLPTNGQLGIDSEARNDGLRVAGDVRVNENAALTSLQTIFMREHNRLADAIKAADPDLTGDQIFHAAREIVAGEMQAITYNEFLPMLLGQEKGLEPYNGYITSVNPGIAQEFSAALYRFSHSMVQDQFLVVNPDHSFRTVPLAECFFNPSCITSSFDVESFLAGLGMQPSQALDGKIVDALRNMLFVDFGAFGIDLLAINLQRGRDHGLPGYLELREALGLGPLSLPVALTDAYGGTDIDLLMGALMEEPYRDSIVGETMHWVLSDQFERLRSGDRFWYENQDFDMAGTPVFGANLVDWLNQQTLGDLIHRNTGISAMPASVFSTEGASVMAASVPGPAPLALLLPAIVALARRRTA